MVCSVDSLASQAGISILQAGGTAADAAVAAGAVLAVTSQHMCGMGGDLFALVQAPGAVAPEALNASGRAGSGADPERLRAEGHSRIPPRGDVRAVTVPGCVDGWLALHDRYGRLPLDQVLHPAIDYAERGFPASPLLAAVASSVASLPGGGDFATVKGAGSLGVRPGVGRALRAVAERGRDGFYLGEFGRGLLHLGGGEFSESDLAEPCAAWVAPLGLDVWGHALWTTPPNSQGYLTLAGAWMAERAQLPVDVADPLWAHLTVEASRLAGFDRPEVLYEGADGSALLAPERLAPRAAAIDRDRASAVPGGNLPGDTAYLCAVDDQRMGVSLIQSNAAGFGAHLVEPSTRIFLHNRGIGFNLTAGHPAEYAPGRRPPHTLSPALLTSGGSMRAVLGTMGGDAQPQVLVQLLARLLHTGQNAGDAVAAPRWVLANPNESGGFWTWAGTRHPRVFVEPTSTPEWLTGLRSRGHDAVRTEGNFGHAHVILCHEDRLEGASDPRALTGDAAGY